MKFPRAEFDEFAGQLLIASKEEGVRPLRPYWGTQLYLLDEIERGLDEGIHFFIVLKGRQQGISTLCQAIDLFWMQKYENMQGQVVMESDDTFATFRDVIREMQDSLPEEGRRATFADNDKMMIFRRDDGKRGSRLMYQVADIQRTKQGRLGRSRGLNYVHATECGSWTDEKGVKSLSDSCAETHPHRLYIWESTAKGFNVWKKLWDGAEEAVTRRRIFIGWWRREDRSVAFGTPAFNRYGQDPPTESESLWIESIMTEYDVAITPEQLAWYRMHLTEEKNLDETFMAQEHPNVPDEAFQAFGDKFIPPPTVRFYRERIKLRPKPIALRYEWASEIDQSDVKVVDPRTIGEGEGMAHAMIFEEPDPMGLYVIGARPARSANIDSPWSVLQVCRAYPDRLEQVAEYASDIDAVFHFAWAICTLAGAYRMIGHTYLNLELSGPGLGVWRTVQDMQNVGRGLSHSLLGRRGDLKSVQGSIINYLFRRPDNYQTRGTTMHWDNSSVRYRPWLWNGMRDEMERRVIDIRSAALLDELQRVRRGEHGDNDDIKGGGVSDDGRAYALALAVRSYLDYAIYDARIAVAPKAPDPHAPKTVEERLVQNFFARLKRGPATVTAR